MARDPFGTAYVVGERDGLPFTHVLGTLTADLESQSPFGLSLTDVPVSAVFGPDGCSVALG